MPPAGPKADPPGPGRADEAEEPWLGFETRPVNTPLVEWIRYHASALMDKGSRRVLRMATDLLARRDPGRPFFLYLHTGEAHMPYLPPWRYRRRFRPAGTRGVRGWRINQYPLPYALGERPISEPQFRVLRALYDGAVAYQDRLIGEAFEGLRRLGLAGNTVFVLLSDHGEMLGEKGILGHHWCAYEPLVRVPLVVSFPGGEARRERRIVQSLDVPRTLVELAGGDEAFRAQQQGNSLLEPGAGPRPADFAVTEHLKPLSRDRLHLRDRLADRYHGVIGFRSAAHKYVWRTTGEEEFYCLETDPEEERNRIDDEAMAREVGRLRGRAAPWLDRFRQAYAAVQAALTREKAPDVSDEVEQRLRELGYVD